MSIVLYISYPSKVLDQLKGAEKNELELGQENEALEDKDSELERKTESGLGTHKDIEETDFDAISMESVDSSIAASVNSEMEPKVEGSVIRIVISSHKNILKILNKITSLSNFSRYWAPALRSFRSFYRRNRDLHWN